MNHHVHVHVRLVLVLASALMVAPVALAAGGHSQLQTFFQGQLTDAEYQKKVFDRVARTWKQPSARHAPGPGKKAIVQAMVSQDGKLISAALLMESGSKVWDAAALTAVKKAAPFPRLPQGYTGPALEVHFHLSWTVTP
ncbi:TonB family protein [Stigmatella sp. ncwal1]|uniref:TonB family protein n=1 Tax=Stigmatella ashevillensis TaxID=2995309 RepID=A0ABT5D6E1_9BACT|nr:TonB family protein [Stigmatella ashevillena]MDC0708665.1 TonB family protein [Stigmatella ashevillena]